MPLRQASCQLLQRLCVTSSHAVAGRASSCIALGTLEQEHVLVPALALLQGAHVYRCGTDLWKVDRARHAGSIKAARARQEARPRFERLHGLQRRRQRLGELGGAEVVKRLMVRCQCRRQLGWLYGCRLCCPASNRSARHPSSLQVGTDCFGFGCGPGSRLNGSAHVASVQRTVRVQQLSMSYPM